MIEYHRNNESLKQAIREHTIHDYPLRVPMFDKAKGIKTNSIRELTAVIVQPNGKITFDDLVKGLELETTKVGLQEWVEYAKAQHMPHADTEPLRWMHPRSRVLLEEGYKISEADIRKEWLRASDHLDKKDYIKSYSFDISQVAMHPDDIEPGMIVQFTDSGGSKRSVIGRVVGTEPDPKDKSKIVYLEVFEPVPALLAPGAHAPWMIQPSFIPDKTWVIGFGTLEAMKRKKVDIPSGMFDPQVLKKEVYFLDQPIPISDIENFCKKYYPDNPQCVWQSMVYMVIPIHAAADPQGRHEGGVFRPFPDDIRKTEIEAQIDYFGEGMEFEG